MRSTRATINLSHLRHNFNQVKNLVGPDTKICIAVKADGYGHGAVTCARALSAAGAHMFGLATADEASELLAAGIPTPLLLLGLASAEEIPELVRQKVALVAGDRTYLEEIWKAAEELEETALIHLKVDLGMGRLGCAPEEVLELATAISRHPRSRLEGFCTHFPEADNGRPEPTATHIRRFRELTLLLDQAGLRPPLVHAANSAGLLEFPESWFSMVRPGIVIYGYPPEESLEGRLNLRPVMTLETRVSFVKTARKGQPLSYGGLYRMPGDGQVATLPLGYADGYFRAFTNKAPVRIGGRLYRVSGRVCMDQFMVDTGPDSGIARGDRAVLFGPEGPTAWDLAREIGTIPYEITCAVSKRVPRVYVES